MAGSYEHVLDGWSMIENMGDSYEATEQLMWLIQSQIGEASAKRLLDNEYYPMCRGEIPEDKYFQQIKRMMAK